MRAGVPAQHFRQRVLTSTSQFPIRVLIEDALVGVTDTIFGYSEITEPRLAFAMRDLRCAFGALRVRPLRFALL